MVLIDLEKAYHRVPRQEVWRCMREKGVPEKHVMIVQDMYEGARTLVKSSVGITDIIPVGVGYTKDLQRRWELGWKLIYQSTGTEFGTSEYI